jgi:hypothetical protein
VLPFRIRGGGVEQPPPFLWCQRSSDGALSLRQVADVISQRSPPATELHHPRQHTDIHVDRAIGDAGVVTGTLEVAIAVAVIPESGTSPKCFLTMLSRSSSSSIVRAEHRIRFAAR